MSEARLCVQQELALLDARTGARIQVDSQYGTGYPHFRGGKSPYGFHNGYHGRAVMRDFTVAGGAVSLTPYELKVGETAAASHDFFQGKGHERKSARWLADRLRETGVMSERTIKVARLAIIGTQARFNENGVLIGQRALELSYPSKAAEKIIKGVASADLGHLFTPLGPYLGHLLYQELQGCSPDTPPPLEDLLDYQGNQVRLVEDYRYPLPEAERVLASHRREVIKYSHDVYKQLERGDIESWDDLIAQDQAFFLKHASAHTPVLPQIPTQRYPQESQLRIHQ